LFEHLSKDEATIPLNYYYYDLMIEWGLTPDQFYSIDATELQRIIEYRSIKNNIEAQKQKQNTKS
jgi:hypothetical protein